MNSTYFRSFHIYKVIQYSGLRKEPCLNAKIQQYIKPGYKVLCINISIDTSGNTWIKTPFGWLCAINEGEVFIR